MKIMNLQVVDWTHAVNSIIFRVISKGLFMRKIVSLIWHRVVNTSSLYLDICSKSTTVVVASEAYPEIWANLAQNLRICGIFVVKGIFSHFKLLISTKFYLI